ncbi:OmpA family protein [Sphingomonas sp. GCM10030256]|uniref:OmpA family protein n=1 Tax=Sphingomonas sp. GCM10030256 TaxID=3273427 RepID=UPI00360A1E61
MKLTLALALATSLISTSTASAQQPRSLAGPTYVFFDFGKLALSRDAEASLTELIASIPRRSGAVVEVVGFSDTAGSTGANRSIALKRAIAVRDFLQARGLATETIRISAHGEQQLLVATADGVREAQNRRVEVRVLGQDPR